VPPDGASGLNVLVFGAARYTGAHIAASLLERGHQVTLLDVRASAQDESDDESASAVLVSEERPLHLMDPHSEGLPLDPSAFDALVFAGHDPYASGAHTPPMRDELEDELAALGLILAAHPRALVLVSSAIVYAPGEPRFSEWSSTSDAVGLAAHCLALESRARDSIAPDGRGLVVLRASVVAGASSRVSRRRRAGKAGYLLPGLTPVGNTDRSVSAVVPDAPEPFADQNTMDFVHVEDLARAVALALEASPADVAGRTFNVGSGRCLNAAQLLPDIDWGETVHVRVDLPSDYASECTATVDASEARRVLGWVPEVDDIRILEEELSCFRREVLGAKRVASATRLLHEYISSRVHGGVLSLYGVIGAMGRQASGSAGVGTCTSGTEPRSSGLPERSRAVVPAPPAFRNASTCGQALARSPAFRIAGLVDALLQAGREAPGSCSLTNACMKSPTLIVSTWSLDSPSSTSTASSARVSSWEPKRPPTPQS